MKCWPANQEIVHNDDEAQEKSLFLILTLDEQIYRRYRNFAAMGIEKRPSHVYPRESKGTTSAYKPVCIRTEKSHSRTDNTQ